VWRTNHWRVLPKSRWWQSLCSRRRQTLRFDAWGKTSRYAIVQYRHHTTTYFVRTGVKKEHLSTTHSLFVRFPSYSGLLRNACGTEHMCRLFCLELAWSCEAKSENVRSAFSQPTEQSRLQSITWQLLFSRYLQHISRIGYAWIRSV
jgi:hypothetical protein